MKQVWSIPANRRFRAGRQPTCRSLFGLGIERHKLYILSASLAPRPPLTIIKLSDNFGQYVLTLKCECGYVRNAQPRTLEAIAGWDASLQGGREAIAMFSMRQAPMHGYRETGNQVRWLDRLLRY